MPLFDQQLYKKRFISYFDLLGTKALLNDDDEIFLQFDRYSTVIDKITDLDITFDQKIEKIRFSDSYIFMADDENAESGFLVLEQFSRFFMDECVQQLIPLRGAMDFGNVYHDKKNNILFGNALVGAVTLSEMQNWIGFVCSSNVVNEVDSYFNFSKSRLHYAPYHVPCTKNIKTKTDKMEYAYIFGENNDQSLNAIKTMDSKIIDEDVKEKYSNSITFIESNSWYIDKA